MSFIKKALILLSLLLLHSIILKAQTPPAPEVIVVRAGRLFDREKGIFLPARTIIVKGNLIEAVGENLPVPSGARVIDLTPLRLRPDLIRQRPTNSEVGLPGQ